MSFWQNVPPAALRPARPTSPDISPTEDPVLKKSRKANPTRSPEAASDTPPPAPRGRRRVRSGKPAGKRARAGTLSFAAAADGAPTVASFAGPWILRKRDELRDLAARAQEALAEETVHDLRTTSRRLREAVRFFAEALPHARAQRLDRAARALLREVRGLRETDVARENLAGLNRDALSQVGGEAIDWLSRRLERSRAREAKKTQKVIAARALKVADRLEQVAEKLARAASPAEGTERFDAQEAARVQLAARQRDVVARATELMAQTTPDPEDMHGVRIALKHWRYAAELAGEMAQATPEGVPLPELRKLQDDAGMSRDMTDLATRLHAERRRLTHKARAGRDEARGRSQALAEVLAIVREAEARHGRAFLAGLSELLAVPSAPKPKRGRGRVANGTARAGKPANAS